MTSPLPPPWVRPGERMLAKMVANHIQGGRPVDGRLYLTSLRLMFVPDQAGVARGGVSSSIPWSDFAGAGISERGSDDPGPSVRRRLRVTKMSGQAELYVVWRPVKAVKMIEEARRGLEQSSG